MGTTATCIACGLASFNSLKVSSIGNVGVAWNERALLATLHNLLLHHTVTSMVQVQLFKQFTRLQTSAAAVARQ